MAVLDGAGAVIKQGSINITTSDNKTYNIAVDIFDKYGHNITGTFAVTVDSGQASFSSNDADRQRCPHDAQHLVRALLLRAAQRSGHLLLKRMTEWNQAPSPSGEALFCCAMEHSVLSEPNTRATARPGICSPEPHRLQRGYTYPCILLGKIYIFVWIW